MRHGLIVYYCASILFLLTIFLLSALSIGHFYGQSSQLTTIYSQNIIRSLGVKIFGSFPIAMVVVCFFGILAQLYMLNALIKFKNYKRFKNQIKISLIVLFAPYVAILLLALKI